MATDVPGRTLDGSRTGSIRDAQRQFTAAALNGDRHGASQVVAAAIRSGHPWLDIYIDIFERSQHDIGELWQRNEISIAVEHLASAVTQHVMATLYAEIPRSEPTRGTAIITAIEAERHHIGAHMVADMATLDGWNVRFLGGDVPTRDLVALIGEVRPVVLGLSVTMVPHLQSVGALVADVREKFGPDAPAIIVGGAAFRQSRTAAQRLAIDGCATDLRSARALLRSLANGDGGTRAF